LGVAPSFCLKTTLVRMYTLYVLYFDQTFYIVQIGQPPIAISRCYIMRFTECLGYLNYFQVLKSRYQHLFTIHGFTREGYRRVKSTLFTKIMDPLEKERDPTPKKARRPPPPKSAVPNQTVLLNPPVVTLLRDPPWSTLFCKSRDPLMFKICDPPLPAFNIGVCTAMIHIQWSDSEFNNIQIDYCATTFNCVVHVQC